MKRFVLVLFFVALLCGAVVYTSRPAQAGTVSMSYCASNVPFHLYHLGTCKKNGAVKPARPMADCELDLTAENATAIADYIAKEQIKPLVSLPTSEYGLASFGGLQAGVYLLIGEDANIDGKCYTPIPYFFTLESGGTETVEIAVQ